MAEQRSKSYPRFSVSQRIEHWVMMLSFTALALTGIPQMYVGRSWAESLIGFMGGIETVRRIHHTAAIVLMLESTYHMVAVGYRLVVLRVHPSILPQPRDLVDLLDDIRYNLGLARCRPQMGHYTYQEKIEYWAVVWGTLIMAITGFMLWNPIATTRFLPGDFVPAAKAAHGGEALLAVLAIITWHVYHVHLKHFNKSIFTGRLTEEEMHREHPLELARIETGQVPPPPDDETKRQRERLYIPVAAGLSFALLLGIYAFVTFEQTAITTLPQRATVVIFAPATSTPTPTATQTPTSLPTPTRLPTATPSPRGDTRAAFIPHVLTGRENCLVCHGEGAVQPFPTDHVGKGNDTCLTCHALAAADSALPTTQPSAVPSFSTTILPLFQAKCAVCHGQLAGLSLTGYEEVMRGGENGTVVVPGKPEESRLIQEMLATHPAQLSEEELAVIQAWIAAGAPNN
ncbi:MAG TPA: hypothetical protein EYP04_05895 [Anaerolineae bacterium]|nr:hypothetical protein [Anaerolineae bacterium]HIQ06513.1 hypothetical protein [Anaerolineae bacterium]